MTGILCLGLAGGVGTVSVAINKDNPGLLVAGSLLVFWTGLTLLVRLAL